MDILNPLDKLETCELTPGICDELRKCLAFSNRVDVDRLFGVERRGGCDFSKVGNITKSMTALFAYAGLHLEARSRRVGSREARQYVYTVAFNGFVKVKKEGQGKVDVDINVRMTDIMKIVHDTRAANLSPVKFTDDVHEFLSDWQMVWYAHLVPGTGSAGGV
jgi:hypothetical protein